VAQVAPPIPGLGFELERYRGHIKALAIAWFVYAGLSLLLGFAALAFAHSYLMGGLGPWTPGPWMHGPWIHGPWVHGPGMDGSIPPSWLPMAMHFALIAIMLRALFAFVVGWGLLSHARWGRVVAIIFAILSLYKLPIGTALGIWTLVMMLGYRNAVLYDQS
jgi:hypothetical protein